MNDQRRRRLESVIHPLVGLDGFSSEQAKKCCSEATPAYVTRTLKQLVRDGLLSEHRVNDKIIYQWQLTGRRQLRPSDWIDQQIHGVQIKHTPRHHRPRERLLREGAASLSDAELLAILIRVGVQKESALIGAQKIANRFAKRLRELRRCSAAELKAISPAATISSYSQIMAGIELGRRISREEKIQPVAAKITSTRDAILYCQREFAALATDAMQEEFHIVTLDTKHKPIVNHRITVGTLDASLVHPREVFRPAIRDAAAAVLLVHNHPSGDPTPSREDHQVTDQLSQAGVLLGIQVLDHIIVARQQCVSVRECSRDESR